MKFLAILAFAVPLLGLQSAPDGSGQPFRLAPGEWRWLPFTVKQIPTEIDCRFRVLSGNPTVHVELLPMREFRLFNLGRKHDTLAYSPDSRSGEFRRLVDERGRYAVVVVNGKNAPPAIVSLEVSTDVNPSPSGMARELAPHRRLAVILISFALFFVTVTWSAVKLMRALNST